jgi:hypothetical protein
LGGQIITRGLAPAPFFIWFGSSRAFSPSDRPSSLQSATTSSLAYSTKFLSLSLGLIVLGCTVRMGWTRVQAKKMSGRWGCRPLWRGGWRDLIGSSILLRGGWLFDCARKQKNNAQEQDRYDHSTTPEAEPNYRRRKRVCGKRLEASLAWKVHLRQYCLLALPYLPPLNPAEKRRRGKSGLCAVWLASCSSPRLFFQGYA